MSRSPRVRLVHLLTEPDATRERRSIVSLAPLARLGIEMRTRRNAPYTEKPPARTCARPFAVTGTETALFPNEWQLGPGHYGCFLAHRDAVREDFDDDVDLFVICECDCILQESPESFVATLRDAHAFLEAGGADYLSLGNGWDADDEDGFVVVPAVFRTHCVVFPAATRARLLEAFAHTPWDTIDYWYNGVFADGTIAIARRARALQAEGMSLLEHVVRDGV